MLKIVNGTGGAATRGAACLTGGGIGDAWGKATECVTRAETTNLYGYPIKDFFRAPPWHKCAHLAANQYTDDTQQTIILAQSLISKNGLDIIDFSARIAEWGKKCFYVPGFDRWAGTSSLLAASKLAEGISTTQSGITFTSSCGSAMRAAPIGIFYADFDTCIKMARSSSMPTHNSEVSKDGAAAVAGMVNLLIHGKMEPIEAANKLVGALINRDILSSIAKAIYYANEKPDMAAKIIGTDSSAKETVGYAVYCFLHSFNDFEATIVTAANVDNGDSDTIAAIAGNFSGAYNGFEAIPKRFLLVEDMELLKKLGDELYSRAQ